ncbi:cytochrome b561 [Monaibacterium marinum]|uniref:Cytochrome b561 n=1 Tax=Pontivivens marinum TaxID=1690039 RepID=A0A2C9CMJ8_9RHOB|nr:cytochrome b [Monaibacterium marinum]SOH92534.1 cytochrome b561 [Monaibacterium marinum]
MSYSYPTARKALHWIIAILVLAMLPMGLIFTDFDNKSAIEGALGEGSFDLVYGIHKSTGFLILGLMLLRTVMAFFQPKPPYEVPLTKVEKAGSGAVHGLLYLLLIAVPVLGWIGVSAYRAPLPFYGLFEMPPIVAQDREFSHTALGAHGIAAKVVMALLVAHIGAALFHGFVKKDGLLRRMIG